MKASIGDIISWEYNGIEYFSEVVAVSRDDDYCVYAVYDGLGYTQDYIEDGKVLRVWEAK
jgi:hypothetical protein